ncbi:MAG: ABC transporter ATP-binding protein/permease, partial [Oscillospiraceae bacterium]|nr:ABC transporter ATP-binding protein/permease [Oscillospiraceae bacterium]
MNERKPASGAAPMPNTRFAPPGAIIPGEKAKNIRSTLKRILAYLGKEKYALVALVTMTMLTAALSLFMPILQMRAINVIADAVEHNLNIDFAQLLRYLLVMGALFLFTAVIVLFSERFSAAVSQRMVKTIRSDMMSKLQTLPVKYFDTHPHGELMSRLTNDADNISTGVSQSMSSLFSSAVTLVGSLVVMFWHSPLMTLVSLLIVPIGILTTKKISTITRKHFRKQQERLGVLNGHIEEMVTGHKTVLAFGRQAQSIAEFDRMNQRLKHSSLRAQIFSDIMMPFMNAMGNLSFALVAIAGGVLIMTADTFAQHAVLAFLAGSVSIGMIQLFLNLSRQMARPINELANQFNMIQSAIAGAERVFDLMDQPAEADDGTQALPGQQASGDVQFEHVNFGYEPEKPVLKDFSLNVTAGQKIALVGSTGAGKTTVVNLLTRFYDIDSGAITLDGVNINSIPKDDLRSSIGIVLQDTVLFTGTIGDNIRYGRLDASDEEIRQAAKTANAHGFIKRLRDGYNTELSEAGGNLSGGQRQLLAIARAVLADPKILILDEATSSVDTRTEMHIQQAMQQLMQNRTCFIIAHRLSTIRNADNILMLSDGRIAESGSHEQLMKQQGAYHVLYQKQLQGT